MLNFFFFPLIKCICFILDKEPSNKPPERGTSGGGGSRRESNRGYVSRNSRNSQSSPQQGTQGPTGPPQAGPLPPYNGIFYYFLILFIDLLVIDNCKIQTT